MTKCTSKCQIGCSITLLLSHTEKNYFLKYFLFENCVAIGILALAKQQTTDFGTLNITLLYKTFWKCRTNLCWAILLMSTVHACNLQQGI